MKYLVNFILNFVLKPIWILICIIAIIFYIIIFILINLIIILWYLNFKHFYTWRRYTYKVFDYYATSGWCDANIESTFFRIYTYGSQQTRYYE